MTKNAGKEALRAILNAIFSKGFECNMDTIFGFTPIIRDRAIHDTVMEVIEPRDEMSSCHAIIRLHSLHECSIMLSCSTKKEREYPFLFLFFIHVMLRRDLVQLLDIRHLLRTLFDQLLDSSCLLRPSNTIAVLIQRLACASAEAVCPFVSFRLASAPACSRIRT